MNCEQAQQAMADALRGERSAGLAEHLKTCSACHTEFESASQTWRRFQIMPDEDPGPHARVRFHEMLEAYEQGARAREQRRGGWFTWSLAWQAGLAAACLVLGFFGGRGMNVPPSTDVAELRKEMSSMRQLVTLSLLQQQSAAERLRGVTWSYRTEPSDMEVLGALLQTINSDPNVNVRLAAIDAVKNFGDSPVARRGLTQALARQTSPLVQVAIVDALVELKHKDAKASIVSLLERADLDPAVRGNFESAAKKLQ